MNSTLEARFRHIQLIGLAMLGTPMLHIVVGILIESSLAPFHGLVDVAPNTLRGLRVIYLMLSLGHVPLIRWLKGRILHLPDDSAVGDRLARADLVALSLADVISVYGLLLFLVSGKLLDVMVMTALSLIALARYFPRRGAWERYASDAAANYAPGTSSDT
jgi:hypothetical protein